MLATDGGQKLQNQLGALCLSSPGLSAVSHTHVHRPLLHTNLLQGHTDSLLTPHTPNDAALVLVVALHVEVAVVSDGEYVRWHLPDLPVGVEANLVSGINRQQLVRVHCNQDGTCVCLWNQKDGETLTFGTETREKLKS